MCVCVCVCVRGPLHIFQTKHFTKPPLNRFDIGLLAGGSYLLTLLYVRNRTSFTILVSCGLLVSIAVLRTRDEVRARR